MVVTQKVSLFKKLVMGISAAMLSAVVAYAAPLKEGTDYTTLKNPVPNAQNTVIEVYSYACPFCFKYSKFIPQVAKSLPSGATFKPYHLEQKGDYGKVASEVFAVLIVKDQEAGIDIFSDKSAFHKAEEAYFNEYHKKNNRWGGGKNPDAFLKTGLDAAGISKADFEAGLKNPKVQALLKEWEVSYEIASIQGVPAFVVNGKYLIYTKSITSLDDLKDKIKTLLAK